MNSVVIDKSLLQGAGIKGMKALSSQFRIHVPDILFYELDTTDDPQVRERCYRALDACDGALERIVSVGELLRFEQREGEPCTPISVKGLVALLSRELLQRHRRTTNARPPAEYLSALPYLLDAFDAVEEFFPLLKGMKVGRRTTPMKVPGKARRSYDDVDRQFCCRHSAEGLFGAAASRLQQPAADEGSWGAIDAERCDVGSYLGIRIPSGAWR